MLSSNTYLFILFYCNAILIIQNVLFDWIQFIIIIIIMSCRQHRYPWLFLATPPYRSSLLAGALGYILYSHRAAIFRFELVALFFLGHVKGPIGEHHLWARPCFSSSVLHVLVRLTWIVFVMEVGGRTAAVLGVLPPGLVQNCSEHMCVVAVEFFLHTFS